MRLRSKHKLNLIDNYVAIYRVLYHCKQLLTQSHRNNSNEELSQLHNICDQTLDLKSKYEDAFQKLKMIDNSFLLLKQQLNESKGYENKIIEICTLSELSDSLCIIERDYLKLKLN